MTATPLEPASPPATTPRSRSSDLHVAYIVRGMPRPVLRGVSFKVQPGEAYGLVGESGCGKSTTAYAAAALPAAQRPHHRRSILVDGDDITKMSNDELRKFRAHARVDGVPGSRRRR